MRVAKRLSYTEDARCLQVNNRINLQRRVSNGADTVQMIAIQSSTTFENSSSGCANRLHITRGPIQSRWNTVICKSRGQHLVIDLHDLAGSGKNNNIRPIFNLVAALLKHYGHQ